MTLLVHVRRIITTWSRLDIGTQSAAVAYYTIFSIAPMLVIAMAVAGLLIDDAVVLRNMTEQLGTTFGHQNADFITSLINTTSSDQTNILISIAGALVIIIGASHTFSALQTGLDKVFFNQPSKRNRSWMLGVVHKILSVGMILIAGVLLLFSVSLTTAIGFISQALPQMIQQIGPALQAIELAVSLILVTVFFAGIYKYLPSKQIKWKPALVAGFFSSILFFITKTILSIVLVGSLFSSYGSASALVLLVFWIFAMSYLFFASAFLARIYLIPMVNE